MRVNVTRRQRRILTCARWGLAILMLCGLAPDAIASDLVRALSSTSVPATLLSLTLMTAVLSWLQR